MRLRALCSCSFFFDEKFKKKSKNKCTLVHKRPPLLLSSPLHVSGGQTKAACCHGSYGNLLANCCCCCFLGDISSKEVKIHSLLSFHQARVSFCAVLLPAGVGLSLALHFLQLAHKASTGLFCPAAPLGCGTAAVTHGGASTEQPGRWPRLF